jgi:hypothetical protein
MVIMKSSQLLQDGLLINRHVLAGSLCNPVRYLHGIRLTAMFVLL